MIVLLIDTIYLSLYLRYRLTERVGVIESTVVELVPKIEKFLTIIELQIEGQKNANIINNQNNAPKRRSLGSGFYKYDK